MQVQRQPALQLGHHIGTGDRLRQPNRLPLRWQRLVEAAGCRVGGGQRSQNVDVAAAGERRRLFGEPYGLARGPQPLVSDRRQDPGERHQRFDPVRLQRQGPAIMPDGVIGPAGDGQGAGEIVVRRGIARIEGHRTLEVRGGFADTTQRSEDGPEVVVPPRRARAVARPPA